MTQITLPIEIDVYSLVRDVYVPDTLNSYYFLMNNETLGLI